MRPVDGKAKSVRQLLQGVKYSIDYYQREYRWEAKQVRELLNDLSEVFLEDYEAGIARSEVARFTHYFLGSIIVSQKNSESFIVDGQQRLMSRAERNQAVWRSKSVPLERRCSAKMSAYDGCRREPLVAARLVEPMRQGNRWLSAW